MVCILFPSTVIKLRITVMVRFLVMIGERQAFCGHMQAVDQIR